jgi:uncharacterized protein
LYKPQIAVVGSGITGLGAAHALSAWANVTVFEKDARPGGHSHAVDIHLEQQTFPVDTGFLVFNDRTYPNLIALFEELQVPIAQSNMSFAITLGPYDYEWCGSDDLSRVFAQPSNIFKPRFWLMLRDMVRFNKAATALAQSGAPIGDQTLQQYLDSNHYSQSFRNDYLLPMAAAIWSCPIQQILAYPLHTFVRFCDNHGLLQVNNRPKWRTVKGSSREYLKRLIDAIEKRGGTLLLKQNVTEVASNRAGSIIASTISDLSLANNAHLGAHFGPKTQLVSNGKLLSFDAVLMACHSDQSLAMLSHPSNAEKAVLGAIQYQPNRAILHTDARLMPKRKRAWAAWNYMGITNSSNDKQNQDLSVTYWLNCLQPLPFKSDVFVTLNPVLEPQNNLVLGEYEYQHPLFDQAAIAAQQTLPTIQGQHGLWFAGAWAGYGFHEDGLKSGLEAAQLIKQHFAQFDQVKLRAA